MKLSEAKPCAACGGPLLKPPMGCWYVIHTSLAMINPDAARNVEAMNLLFGGALRVAEVFAPGSDDAIVVAGDKDPALWTKAHICFDCYAFRPLGEICESINRRIAEQGAAA